MIIFPEDSFMSNRPIDTAKSARILIAMLAGLILILPANMALAREKPADLLFQMSDSDGNGLISEAEWHSAMQKRMETVDTNHDGNLSREEFDQARQTIRERMRGMSPRARSGNQLME